jgi:SpoVK/Ycf46/Vps4 family AAA+-type ATPase
MGGFMKKKNVLNLIRYYAEKNDPAFRNEAYEIARYFDSNKEYQLSEYIMALLSNANTFSPQMNEEESSFFRKVKLHDTPLPLPEIIKEDIIGIVNAVNHKAGINKFLFEGAPGTGKTETAKQLARILERELFAVDFEMVIDSKLGQTAKNIANLFEEINNLKQPDKAIVLFDEIDAIAIDRINSNDLREMGRATSAVLKGFDHLNNSSIIVIATTNLFNAFDKALIRRFDAVINFNRYSNNDLIEVASVITNYLLDKFKLSGRNIKLLKKLIKLIDPIPYPGELKNLINTSIAFSNPSNEFDYLKRLFITVTSKHKQALQDLKKLQDLGFTVREIEILTGVSKSQASRELKEEDNNE